MASTLSITTAEQLLEAGDIGRCELVRGEVVMMSPAGSEHGGVIGNISAIVWNHVKSNRLGRTFGAETGFIIGRNPDTVRAPDVAFVRKERLSGKLPRGFFPGAPDLAVEVVSPGDRASEMLAKAQEWLAAGCRLVWVADPKTRSVSVYRSLRDIIVLTVADVLSGDDVLPGFSVPVSEIFE
jgi:Uma2 family endonuclease